jgi:hypothetical protein
VSSVLAELPSHAERGELAARQQERADPEIMGLPGRRAPGPIADALDVAEEAVSTDAFATIPFQTRASTGR